MDEPAIKFPPEIAEAARHIRGYYQALMSAPREAAQAVAKEITESGKYSNGDLTLIGVDLVMQAMLTLPPEKRRHYWGAVQLMITELIDECADVPPDPTIAGMYAMQQTKGNA